MNSLRTDDILGAKPRVRHMPLNLLRERRVPTAFLTNMQPINPEWQTQNNYKSYQAYEYGNHQYQNQPIYSHPIKNKEARYVNYDSIKNNMSIGQISKSRYQNPIRESVQIQTSQKPKSQPRIQETRNRASSKSKNQLQRHTEEIQNGRKSEVQSRRSMDSKEVRGEEGKKIFRGLGFNIISNHKFEYTFQHKAPDTRF